MTELAVTAFYKYSSLVGSPKIVRYKCDFIPLKKDGLVLIRSDSNVVGVVYAINPDVLEEYYSWAKECGLITKFETSLPINYPTIRSIEKHTDRFSSKNDILTAAQDFTPYNVQDSIIVEDNGGVTSYNVYRPEINYWLLTDKVYDVNIRIIYRTNLKDKSQVLAVIIYRPAQYISSIENSFIFTDNDPILGDVPIK